MNSEAACIVHAILLLLGMVAGVTCGMYLQTDLTTDARRTLHYLELPGTILLNVLHFTSVPLIISSVVTGITNVGNFPPSKLILAALLYFMTTTLLATITGTLVIVTVLIPDHEQHETLNLTKYDLRERAQPLVDIFIMIFPENLVTAYYQTVFVEFEKVECDSDVKDLSICRSAEPRNFSYPGPNYLGLIVVFCAVGSILNKLEDRGTPLKALFHSFKCAIDFLGDVITWYTPFGIVSLIATNIAYGNYSEQSFDQIEKFISLFLIGLAIHTLFTLPIFYLAITKRNPIEHAFRMTRPLCTAFCTDSNVTCLIATKDSLLAADIDKDIVNILVPISTILNQDGTAVYHACVCIYITLANNYSLHIVKLMILRHRIRTVANNWGNCICAGILDHYFSDIFQKHVTNFDIGGAVVSLMETESAETVKEASSSQEELSVEFDESDVSK